MTYQYVLGIDLSKWQAEQVNWSLVVERMIRFAWVKGADGVIKDGKFDLHWQTSAGFVYRGVYLYYRDQQDPIEQADKLFEYCQAHGDLGELPPALDIEETNNPTLTASKIKTCLERLEVKFGRKPIIYTSAVIWNKHLGNVAWADDYDLWDAHYPYSAWFPQYVDFCRNLDPNIYPARPIPWKDAGLKAQAWQICGFAPASEYGVSTNPLAKVDLNFFPGTEQDLEDYAEWIIAPPPPDPIGEPAMQFITKYAINVRSGPNTTYSDIGDLPAGYVLTALEIQATDNNSVWVRFDTGKWVALVHNGGGPYLNYHPAPPPAPVPVILMQTITNTNLRWYNAVNGAGKPIMAMPPADNRPKFAAGAVIACKPGKIDCDGTVDYYEVLNGQHATPKTYTPPTGYTGWFVSELDVFEVQP